jgi:hypothetical protein
VLQQKIEEDFEASAAEVLEHLPLGTDGALIDAGKGLEQLASPLVHMLESDITLERMNDCLDKVDAFLRIRHCQIEHFALSNFALLTVVDFDLIDVLLDCLQLF